MGMDRSHRCSSLPCSLPAWIGIDDLAACAVNKQSGLAPESRLSDIFDHFSISIPGLAC